MSSVRTVRFKDLKLWDYKSNVLSRLSKSKYRVYKMAEFLHRVKDRVEILDGEIYNRVKIKNHFRGATVRDSLEGAKIKVKKQFRIKEGQFLYSTIDARNGSFAIVSSELNGAIITNSFANFNVDESIVNPYFLIILLQNPKIKEEFQALSVGSTGRKTVKVHKLLNLEIEIPPLKMQNEMIAKLKELEDKIKALEQEKLELNKEIYKLLGIDSKSGGGTLSSSVKIVRFKDLERWDIKNYLENIKSNYPLTNLKNLIFENKDKVKPFLYPNDDFDILGVNNKNGVFFNETLKGSKIKQPYIKVKSGDIFYNPYRVNVGSIGIVPAKFDAKFTSPAYVVFSVDENKLRKEFLLLILKSSHFNGYLRSKTIGSVRQILSFKALQDLQIPLPPLKIQNEFALRLAKVDENYKILSKKLEQIKGQVIKDLY